MKCGKGLLTNCVMKDVFRHRRRCMFAPFWVFGFPLTNLVDRDFFHVLFITSLVCVLSMYIAVCRYGV